MRAYSLKKAKEIVRSYNRTKSAQAVSEELNLPWRDVAVILRWLERHDPSNQSQNQQEAEYNLAVPSSHIWVKWCYVHNVSPRIAAAVVCWPYQRLLESCGGPEEWVKQHSRAPIALHDSGVFAENGDGPGPNDPTPDEIEQRKLEVMAMRERNGIPRMMSQEEKRVEVTQYVFDGRNMRFDSR